MTTTTRSPNHHLWRNGRLWWIAFTIRLEDGETRRVRRSLRTADVARARVRRDAVLEGCRASPSLEVRLRA